MQNGMSALPPKADIQDAQVECPVPLDADKRSTGLLADCLIICSTSVAAARLLSRLLFSTWR